MYRYVYIYIYVTKQRQRKRERERYTTYIHACICIDRCDLVLLRHSSRRASAKAGGQAHLVEAFFLPVPGERSGQHVSGPGGVYLSSRQGVLHSVLLLYFATAAGTLVAVVVAAAVVVVVVVVVAVLVDAVIIDALLLRTSCVAVEQGGKVVLELDAAACKGMHFWPQPRLSRNLGCRARAGSAHDAVQCWEHQCRWSRRWGAADVHAVLVKLNGKICKVVRLLHSGHLQRHRDAASVPSAFPNST